MTDGLQFIDLMNQKNEVLEKLSISLEFQQNCFVDEMFEEEEYERLQGKTDDYIRRINELNAEFDQVYSKMKDHLKELIDSNESFEKQLKALVQKQEELGSVVQDKYKTLRETFDRYLVTQQKKLNARQMQRKTAATYYKTMTKQMNVMSNFYDQVQ